MMINFEALEKITHGVLIQKGTNPVIKELLIDSRNVSKTDGALFFAISGKRNDGHDYIDALYAKGVRAFVVERLPVHSQYPEAGFIKVTNSIAALQQVAATHRSAHHFPLVGITGSNGKTIVKEWLYQLISPYKRVVKTPQSYNSQVGVPLSIWKMNASHELGLFEAGISQSGEMDQLYQIIKPQIGIFTNIGPAHSQGFNSLKHKIEEKSLLFKTADTIIYCKDHVMIDRVLSRSTARLFTWGKDKTATLHIEKTKRVNGGMEVVLLCNGTHTTLYLPFDNDVAIENSLHCVALMFYLGFSFEKIQKGIKQLRGVKMRLELKQGINQCYIIDDAYNNDLAGLSAAIDFLNQQRQHQKKTLILSDILQSGLEPAALYREVAGIIHAKGVDRLIAIGPALYQCRALFDKNTRYFEDTDTFLSGIKNEDFEKEMILVKGARRFEFEKIVNRLQQKIHRTILEIDLNALIHNLNFYRAKISPDTRIMVMVKAFAYGSGSHEVAHLLQFHKVDYLAVAYPDEGMSLRDRGISLPIMVMNSPEDSFESLLSYRLEPEIYSLEMLIAFARFLKDKKAKIHLKVDTGMKRLGFVQSDIEHLVEILQNHPNLEVVSVFSHLAGADDESHNDFSTQQAKTFLTPGHVNRDGNGKNGDQTSA